MKKSKSRKILIAILVAVGLIVLSIIITAAYVLSLVANSECGLQSLKISNTLDKGLSIRINYVECIGYSIEKVKDDFDFRRGEAIIEDIDDYLPENRILITLGDCDWNSKFAEKYSPWEIYDAEIDGKDLKFMWYPNSDHGICIFLASSYAFEIEEQPFVRFNELREIIGTVKFKISFDE